MRHVRDLVLVGLLVAAATPAAAARAATAWFYERQPIPEGQAVEVASSGSGLKLKLLVAKQPEVKLECAAAGVEALRNSATNGLDETRSISFSCTAPCGRVSLVPTGLPWTSILEGTEQPLRDQWDGVHLKLTCGTTNYGVFAGTLKPRMGDNDPQGPGLRDDLDNGLFFYGGIREEGRLFGPRGSSLSITGTYRLGSRGGEGKRATGATGEVV